MEVVEEGAPKEKDAAAGAPNGDAEDGVVERVCV